MSKFIRIPLTPPCVRSCSDTVKTNLLKIYKSDAKFELVANAFLGRVQFRARWRN